jgi:AIPR protein
MARAISEIADIARYRYKVVLLANLDGWSLDKLRQLTGGHPTEVYDHEQCYQNLLFPIVSGTYFNAADLTIYIDLSNKSAGSKITYSVQTSHHDCEITVLFVPIAEVARLMSKYKNSILRYNPRSYLDFQAEKVNAAIRNTILGTEGNEFALLNNGITIISDETSINERIGQKNRAQLHVKNPQIINGGQTAFTLSRAYEDSIKDGNATIFDNKEVLVKIITLNLDGTDDDGAHKLALIEQISTATNQQTAVTNADRVSNNQSHLEIQKMIFDRYGLLYERKRGEFGDGRHSGYVDAEQVIDRNLFIRIYLAANGDFNRKTSRKLFAQYPRYAEMTREPDKLDRCYWGLLCYRHMVRNVRGKEPGRQHQRMLLAKVYAITQSAMPRDPIAEAERVHSIVANFEDEWAQFILEMAKKDTKWQRARTDRATKQVRTEFYEKGWLDSGDFVPDVKSHFGRALS